MPGELTAVMRLLGQASTGLHVATGGLSLLTAVQRAANGDVAAQEYLRQEGVHEAADLLMPGAGQLTRNIRQQVRDFRAAQGVIEGEYRIIDGQRVQPWDTCRNWLLRRDWGTFCLLGPKGQGKTTMAFRLAQRWQERTGYPVSAINVYPDDVPSFAVKRPSWWFVGLTKRLLDILDPPAPRPKAANGKQRLRVVEADETDEAVDEFEDAEQLEPSIADEAFIARYSGQILIIDEMSAFCGTNPSDPKRILVRRIVQQARHLNLLLIFIGQIARHVPEDLLNCEAIFVKKPLGDEAVSDRDNPLVVKIWEDSSEAFRSLPDSPWLDLDGGMYADVRSWAYTYCRSCSSDGYFGLLPFRLPEGAD